MAENRDLAPEAVLKHLDQGRMFPYYLFYGPNEFRLEQVLNRIRERLIPQDARDFNLRVFYGDDAGISAGAILEAASMPPFLGAQKLVIVRRIEALPAKGLTTFLPYLDNPVATTCLLFVSQAADFRKKFFQQIRKLGRAVQFRPLQERQIVPWIQQTAKGLGLHIDREGCGVLRQIVGERMGELYSELEKLQLLYGNRAIGVPEVEKNAVHSRNFTIFELMDHIAYRQPSEALAAFHRYVEEQGKDSLLPVLSMINRQIRLMWKAKAGQINRDSTWKSSVGLPRGIVARLELQAKPWSITQLREAIHMLYDVDTRLKSGSDGRLVLENLIFSLTYAAGDSGAADR